jgi:uncharacterized protein YyaL (SSP411 family)
LEDKFIHQKHLLWKMREKRVHPLKDDKILSSWNGLMIFSLAEAGSAFNEKRIIDAALKAARFIKSHLWQEGTLLRRWRDGQALYNAGLDEYAFLIRGLLSLFEADGGTEWLKWAMELSGALQKKFKEPEGAFYQTDGSDPHIILKKCQFSDGAEPSGNAIQCENLLRLYQLTAEADYFQQAEDIFKAVKKYIDNYPPGYCYHVMNLIRYYDSHAPTLVVALNEKEEFRDKIRELIYSHYIPHKAVIWRHPKDKNLFQLIPFVKNQEPIDGKTTLYICFEGVCQQPLNEITAISEAVKKL